MPTKTQTKFWPCKEIEFISIGPDGAGYWKMHKPIVLIIEKDGTIGYGKLNFCPVCGAQRPKPNPR